jgi:O-antigen/teichoic acid export membrane protein
LLFLLVAPFVVTVNISIIIIATQLCFFLVIIFMIILLRPSFANLWKRIKEIMHFQKSYGLPLYIGYLVGNATGQINRMAIVFWVDSASIGFFSLAYTLVEPLRLIPNSVATASFREFSSNKRVPKKILVATLISTAVTLVVIQLVLVRLLNWVYPAEYAAHISPLSQVLAFGAVIQGFAELFNRFLGAHGQGRQLKFAAYAFGATYVLGTLVMTPLWGVWGTVGSVVLASSINLSLMLFFYKKVSFGSDLAGEK